MSVLATKLEDMERAERTAALRYLLRHPLVCASDAADMFATIVRHRNWLTRWFLDQPSWKLVVEPKDGFARLHKVPARVDGTRPARSVSAGKLPFDRRRYVLLCLTLAALEEAGSQITLARLADIVAGLSADEPDIEDFDTDRYGDRCAFVDALRWLVAHRVLRMRDGDESGYARSGAGDALYDVDDRLLGQLLAAPRPPSMTERPDDLLAEQYPETDDGIRQRARHLVFRLLLDEPVVYYDELPPDALSWLTHSRGMVYARLQEDVGMRVERRREGLAAVDPEGDVSDVLFPDGGSTVKHAALLLAEWLTRALRAGAEVVSDDAINAQVVALTAEHGKRGRWSKQFLDAGDDGALRLAAEAMALLAGFRLVARVTDGWRPLPAIARFAAGSSGDDAPKRRARRRA
ncbi:TIGR02678 family protein [Haliangium ochraceum]|uniref:TIGR02678 family protein n=1 Tax=Haliangium ochraceum (strain DSM 14365 / JCM 11303 / SMP-2) TaxID=502025 RepID=D0LPM9_HALO1|nr:TIGR02678 family protein [Haliangium ochraceum]ACY15392.1 conserved hypothetical protein [Haliangium ochraceum DSM 14365]